MDRAEIQKKLAAAESLLSEGTTTREKFTSVRALVRGINPALDRALSEVDRNLGTVEKLIDGKIITLAAEHLSEGTEEEKKRKKALLLFIRSWEKLGSEIARVKAELQNAENADTSAGKASHIAKIIKGAAGPLGLVTLIAVGAVVLQSSAVAVVIENDGCGTFTAAGSLPIPLPGFALPEGPIPDGGTGTLTVPPVSVTADGTAPGALSVSALAFDLQIELPKSARSVTFDDTELLGTTSTLTLAGKDEHRLVVTCR